MSHVTRSKLQQASGSGARDNGSLHRWVLLKNSIVRTTLPDRLSASAPCSSSPELPELEPEVETEQYDEVDAFMFPDPAPAAAGLEQQWFASLMETLDDDDEDEEDASPSSASTLPALPDSDDDDDWGFSPSTSPMSSSDDLATSPPAPVSVPAYCPPPIALPYPVPYPVFSHRHHHHPPPLLVSQPEYCDDVDDMPVPDAIADDSDADDDSDALSTPSLLRSSASASALRKGSSPHVVDPDDASFFLAGLPFFPFSADDVVEEDDARHPLRTLYAPQEC